MVIVDDNRGRSPALTCLRLYNVQQEENETAEDCFHKIKEIIKGAALDIPDPVIDRAHRVGAGYNNKPPAMIVKFTTSRHRTKLYRARKEIKEKFGYSLQVDLAKENLYTLKKVREIGKENKDATGFEFAYANVNCVLFMKISGRFEKFTTVEEASQLMGLIINEEGVHEGSETSSSDIQENGVEGYVNNEENDGHERFTTVEQSNQPIELVISEEDLHDDSETSSSDSQEKGEDSYDDNDENDGHDKITSFEEDSQPMGITGSEEALNENSEANSSDSQEKGEESYDDNDKTDGYDETENKDNVNNEVEDEDDDDHNEGIDVEDYGNREDKDEEDIDHDEDGGDDYESANDAVGGDRIADEDHNVEIEDNGNNDCS